MPSGIERSNLFLFDDGADSWRYRNEVMVALMIHQVVIETRQL